MYSIIRPHQSSFWTAEPLLEGQEDVAIIFVHGLHQNKWIKHDQMGVVLEGKIGRSVMLSPFKSILLLI